MLKGRILLVVALYIILGVIAFLNFGLYRYITEKPEWKSTAYSYACEDIDKTILSPPTEDANESQGSSSEKEINN
jgi:hypothetical protein